MERVCDECEITFPCHQLKQRKEYLLSTASKRGHHKCVEWLIKAGADVNWFKVDTFSLLGRRGHGSHVKLLRDARADVDNCNDDGYTA